MGNCYNCGTEFTLKQEDIKCDSCGKVVNFPCHNCKQWFSIYDEETQTKRKECGICGFFVCPYCGACGTSCDKDLWQTQITRILSPEITYQKIPNLQKKINALLNLIEEIKISHDKKQCDKGVPITYAKGRIKFCVGRMLGYRIKSEGDLDAFIKRYQKIIDVLLGTKLTINSSREEGSYGQEFRDVFNLAICRGKLKKQKETINIDGEEKEIEVYRRTENGYCPFFDGENLIIKVCPRCKKEYPEKSPTEFCDCYIYKKGKNIGQPPKLKLKLSNKDTCQLNKGLFKKDGEGQHC